MLRRAAFAAVTIAVAAALPASAYAHRTHHPHSSHHAARSGDSRYAAIVVDAASGRVVEATNPDRRSYPASLTKVMTLYLLFDALEQGRLTLDSELPVSEHAAAQAPSKLGLRPGELLRVEDLILSLVTKSANDAAVVAGEALGGSEPRFAALMTRKAHELGMTSTTYRNASGLPNLGQMTTPRDQAILARAMIHNHRRYYRFFATREFDFHGQVITSHNRVTLHYPGADGMKTGYINASGFNLITSAVHGGRRLVGVVFGGRTAAWRDQRMELLLDTGFARADGGATVAEAGGEPEPEPAADPPPAQHVLHPPTHHLRMAAAYHPAARAEDDSEGDDDPPTWAIQVGAFSGRTPAHHAAVAAARKLGGLVAEASVDIDQDRDGHRVVYRARLTGLTEDQAHAACRKLERSKKECRVVTPNA